MHHIFICTHAHRYIYFLIFFPLIFPVSPNSQKFFPYSRSTVNAV